MTIHTHNISFTFKMSSSSPFVLTVLTAYSVEGSDLLQHFTTTPEHPCPRQDFFSNFCQKLPNVKKIVSQHGSSVEF